jgi:integral membrane protein
MTITAADPQKDQTTDRLIAVFRTVAIAEAISWGALLVAMVFKYGLIQNEAGVRIVGPIHGAIFIAYLVATLAVGVRGRWTPKIVLLGLFAAVPPFLTVVFERWAEREGHLRLPDAEPAV